MSAGTKRILAIVTDLLFRVKIEDAAKRAGVEVVFAASRAAALAIARENPALTIFDLDDAAMGPLELIRELKEGEETKNIRILGYVSHVHADRIRAAKERGCDEVIARSAFSQRMTALLQQYAGAGARTA